MCARRKSLDQQWREHADRLLLDPARPLVMAALVSPNFYRFGYHSECSGVTTTVLARHVRRLRLAHSELRLRAAPLGYQPLNDHTKMMAQIVSSARELGKSARS